MKKKNLKQAFRLKPADIVIVNSRAYGEHTRAARGSKKPALLNDTMARKSKELGVLTAFAREVHNLLKLHAGFFKETTFWQHMLSRLHKVTTITTEKMLKGLEGLELNRRHPLTRFGEIPSVYVKSKDNHVTARFTAYVAPYRKKPFNDYCYDVIILYFDENGKAQGSVATRSRWVKSGEAGGVFSFALLIAARSTYYLLCLRLHLGKDGEPINGITSQGMKVICSGVVRSY